MRAERREREPGSAEGTALELKIGISSCLLGEQVRFDGGHKRDPFLTDVLGPHVEWVRVCPEVEVGMGTPRETLRLVRAARRRAHDHDAHGRSITPTRCAPGRERRVDALAREDLDGYVLKKDSPSCGMERVKVYSGTGMPARDGRGLFAEALLERASRCCRSRRKGGSPIPRCARTSSSACSPIGA